jgi:hypothetical protein
MKELIAALIKAQGEFDKVRRGETANIPTKNGAQFSYKYADLETCIAATLPALRENGLLVVQTFSVIDGKSALVTTLYHTSGEYMQGSQLIESKDPGDPQKMGASSTYARRYGYLAILGIAPEDDDAEIATKPHSSKPLPQAKPEQKKEQPKTENKDIKGEIVSGGYNVAKKRSEYVVRIGEDEQITVFIKKPLNTELIETSKVELVGYREWKPEGKNTVYHLAEDIRASVYDDTEIPF